MAALRREQAENDRAFGWLDGYEPTGTPEDTLMIAQTMGAMLSKLATLQMLDIRAQWNQPPRRSSSYVRRLLSRMSRTSSRSDRPSRWPID